MTFKVIPVNDLQGDSRSMPLLSLTLASAIPEIFKSLQNLKVGHVTLITALSGTVCYWEAGTCYDKPIHQI